MGLYLPSKIDFQIKVHEANREAYMDTKSQ